MARKKRITHCVDPLIIDKNCEVFGDRAEIVGGFARRFNDLLEKRQIDQEKLAEDTGISMSCISSYRNGKSEPKLSNIVLIAKYLGVDCHYLLAGVSSQNRNTAENTGLSEQSILSLSELKNDELYPQKMEIINDLICSSSFGKLLEEIWFLRDYVRIASEAKKAYLLGSINYNAFETAIKQCKTTGYFVSIAINDFLDEAYNFSEIASMTEKKRTKEK